MDEKSIECILGGYTLGHLAAYCINGFIKQAQNKFGCASFAELCGWDCGHYQKPEGFPIVLNAPNIPYINLAPPLPPPKEKNTCQIFLPKKIPESKISNLPKSLDHPRFLKSGVIPPSKVFTSNNVF